MPELPDKPYCTLCRCENHNDIPGEQRWYCPLIEGPICQTDCVYELAGGTGSLSVLLTVSRLKRKSPQQIHKICVECPHGGKTLSEFPEAEKGDTEEIKEAKKKEVAFLKWIRRDYSKSMTRRINVQKGFDPMVGS
jgi:hypothetical protein